VLFYGAMGTGKSTCARQLACALAECGKTVDCISADPGTPQFGAPGAASLAHWQDDDWQVHKTEALCSLNAVRFRLPLIEAVRRLIGCCNADFLLVDTPGAVRGNAAQELISALVAAAQPDLLVYLHKAEQIQPIERTFTALPCPIVRHLAHADAVRPPPGLRAQARTALWLGYLRDAVVTDLNLDNLALLGTPPRTDAPGAWQGLQVALYRDGELLSMGVIVDRKGSSLRVRARCDAKHADALLLRDARQDADGTLRSVEVPPKGATDSTTNANEAMSEVPVKTALSVGDGLLKAKLINGVFGDPLLELHLRGQSGRLLFDLGDAGLLSRRMLHKVSDVFITHAHFDHVCGFLDMLRARMTGRYPPLRIYGPPGMTAHILAAVASIDWDRIGDDGPELHIADIFHNTLNWSYCKVGKGVQHSETLPIKDNLLLQQPEYSVRHCVLDHGIPVLAYSLELAPRYLIRKDILRSSGWPPGPWLKTLKQALDKGRDDVQIVLPDGATARVAQLRQTLVDLVPGKKLTYATDFADTPTNRKTLIELADRADLFFCESTFVNEDRTQAAQTCHLTAGACGEIAAAACVRRLVPFHFSKRYTRASHRVYEQVAASCGDVRITRVGY
jgi:ribonuclease BN (tRNA processing enzyme)